MTKPALFLAVVLLVSACREKPEKIARVTLDDLVVMSTNSVPFISFSTSTWRSPMISVNTWDGVISFDRGHEKMGSLAWTETGLVFEGNRQKSLAVVSEIIDSAKKAPK